MSKAELKEFLSGSLNPVNAFKTIEHNVLFARDNPDYFYPSGIWAFTGAQGKGKTLSMVQTVKKICQHYPKAIVCTNIDIKGIKNEVIPFTDYSDIANLTNGIYGVIFVLDELHILWNSLESKDIPFSEMACFCQNRKDRRLILGTAQVKSRIAKPIREQLQYIIDCDNIFGLLQFNTVYDPTNATEVNGRVDCEIICKKFWFHYPDLYKSYDTLFKIEKAKRKPILQRRN